MLTTDKIDLEVLLRHAHYCLEDTYDILHSQCEADNDHARHDLRQLARAINIVEDLQHTPSKL